MRWRLIAILCLLPAAAAATALWIVNARVTDRWFAVHTGISDVSGPWYGFWSGFGSDLAEFGIIGAIGTGVYQLVRKYNCHEPGCWRVGTHPAAGGQFLLCYRHHPDFAGKKPSHELIERLHRQQAAQQAGIHDRLDRIDHFVHHDDVHPDAGPG